MTTRAKVVIALFFAVARAAAHPRSFTECGTSFCLDGAPFALKSGSMHFFRVHPSEWPRGIALLKAAGFNAVATYLPWYLLEPEPGVWDATGANDYVAFLREVEAAGLLAIVRIGPYITGELDFGGLPYWLLRDVDANATRAGLIRTTDPWWMGRVSAYFAQALPPLRSLLYAGGGPIAMIQIDDDSSALGQPPLGGCNVTLASCKYHGYLAALRDEVAAHGLAPSAIVTTVGLDANITTPGVLQTHEFSSIDLTCPAIEAQVDQLRAIQPGRPAMVGETYPGHVDVVGAPGHYVANGEKYARGVACMLAYNASLNVYMAFGGTSFGFIGGGQIFGRNGSVFSRSFVTSYDFDAPVNESADANPSKFAALQQVLLASPGDSGAVAAPPVPAPAPKGAYGAVAMAQTASLIGAVDAGTVGSGPAHVNASAPAGFAALGSRRGYALYTATVPPLAVASPLAADVRDKGWVLAAGKFVGTLGWWRLDGDGDDAGPVMIPASKSPQRLDILVANLGRCCDALRDLSCGRRGILGNVTVGGVVLAPWTMTPLPLDGESAFSKVAWSSNSPQRGPTLFRGTLVVPDGDPRTTFLRVGDGWTSGFVVVNGFHLGRFDVRGPQRTLLVPRAVLRAGDNEVIAFDGDGGAEGSAQPLQLDSVAVPDLGKPIPL